MFNIYPLTWNVRDNQVAASGFEHDTPQRKNKRHSVI